MTSRTVSSFFLVILSCTPAWAQSADTQQMQFNQVLNINGDMKLNSFQFPDRSRIETFSQKQQQLIVNQQTPAIPANQVTGTTGQPFVAISPQSMTVSTNGATDLVGGQVQMAMSLQFLQQAAVQPDNTYVAMLSPDRQTWMIQETMRSINSTDMTVRMVKRNQLDGEYMVVGRQTIETNTIVQPFGSDAGTSVAIQGTGLQENEFQDGFRMSTRATQPMTMNVDVTDGIDSSMLAALKGQESVNDYRYKVTTNLGAVTPDLNKQVTVIQMPINAIRIQKMMQAMGVPPTGQVAISVAQRGVLQNPGGATGNLGGAAAARRFVGRDGFRKVARQVQNGQLQAAQAQEGQVQAGQIEAGQAQGAPVQAGQPEAGQIAAAQPQDPQLQAPPPQNPPSQPATPTTNPNPVAAQLLLAPTFTPIQAPAVLDQTNMRIAIPVRQVDGEYILTMQVMGAQGKGEAQAAPAPAAEGQGTKKEGEKEGGKEGGKARLEPSVEAGRSSNSTSPAPPKQSGEPLKPQRRQLNPATETDKYGLPKPPPGSVIMSMKMIDDMAEAVRWGGQAAITRMMSEYVKSQAGKA